MQVFPIFYVLTTSKSADCYKSIYEFIESRFPLNSKESMFDFEAGLRKALKEVYPNVILRGCWFHYRKCLLKRIKNLGISSYWNKKRRNKDPERASKTKRIYRIVSNLPLLPANHFSAGYQYAKRIASKFKLDKTFEIFFQYFQSTWVAEVC